MHGRAHKESSECRLSASVCMTWSAFRLRRAGGGGADGGDGPKRESRMPEEASCQCAECARSARNASARAIGTGGLQGRPAGPRGPRPRPPYLPPPDHDTPRAPAQAALCKRGQVGCIAQIPKLGLATSMAAAANLERVRPLKFTRIIGEPL